MRGSSLSLAIGVLALVACGGDRDASDTTAGQTTTAGAQDAQKVGETPGFETPESVVYDGELDVFYVSNVNGNPNQKDNNGWIGRVRADSVAVMTRLVQGGQRGATLNAPKGMALRGDTLFVADIDAVRMFNRRDGAPLGSVELARMNATFLNDVVAAPDGIYITDTGIRFDAQGNMTSPGGQRVFRIVGRQATQVLAGDSLGNPNGIAWDGTNNRFIIVPFASSSLMTWKAGDAAPATLTSGPGQYDGVEVLNNGNVLVSSWADSTVYIAHGGTHMMPLVRNVPAPADIGVDTKRNILAVPLFMGNKVEYYSIP